MPIFFLSVYKLSSLIFPHIAYISCSTFAFSISQLISLSWFLPPYDTTLMAESEEELKSFLMKVKEEGEKVDLKLNIQKIKIMASGPITSWQIGGETVRNANQNHNEVQLHASQDGCYPKVYKFSTLATRCEELTHEQHQSGLLFPSPGDLSNLGIKPTLQKYSLPSEPPGKAHSVTWRSLWTLKSLLQHYNAPKFISNQTIYYSWEGNPINISCDVKSNPPASVHWRREKLVLPAKNTTNLKTYSTGRKIILEIAPTSDNDFGRYNCTATNRIGTRFQEYILALADVPSSPYGVKIIELSQTTAKVSFSKPDSHGGVPINHYQVDVKEVASETWKIVRSHGVQSEPSPPSIHGQPSSGKSFKLSITKQDDGGAPILEYIVKYRSKDKEDQWLEKKVQGNKDHIILEHLQWTMGYEVQITAANRLGYSEPTVYEFSMPPKPNIIKGKQTIKLPLKEENGKEVLNPETIEIKVSNDIIQSKEDDSKA
ncbi:hypothetical protein FD754_020936 [Muntiacus muntjak]|uniref:Neural cell adhesion molecule 2 n=1 Tax=Muntiacus muntjak TaxID=9888 RepID=A0A5N3V634_MUNMU|nr:hypothetical protein FD754_020936 [Muntiacus muntjak]